MPLPDTLCIELHQRGDHVEIVEDVAIAIQNMSSLLMHASQHSLRGSCIAALHPAPVFLSGMGPEQESQSFAPAPTPQCLNALASLYPSHVIEGLLSGSTAAHGSAAAPSAPTPPSNQWEVGAMVTAKCPVTKKFRVCKVVQANERSVQVQFTMPDRSNVCVSYPPKFLRAAAPLKGWAKASEAGSARQSACVPSNAATSTSIAPSAPIDDDIIALSALTLLPTLFHDSHYQPLFATLLQASSHKSCEYRAIIAIASLVSTANFVSHMSAADATWISQLGPVCGILNRADNGTTDRKSQDVLKAAVVSLFDSLLRSASSADQRRAFIAVMLRAAIIHALFQFCQVRDALSAARDTAACVVLSCAAVSPSRAAIAWIKSTFRRPRGSSSENLLQDISVLWTAASEHGYDDFDDNRCVLSVERYNLIGSSVKSFGFCTLQGLAKRLKVNFVLERGCDAGGLTVEWLHLLLDTVFSDVAFFLPVLLPSGQPSGLVRINHSAANATILPYIEVFRMVGCCLALCLQVLLALSTATPSLHAANSLHTQLRQSASSRCSLAPSVLKYIMRAPLSPADLQSEHPGLAEVRMVSRT